MTNKKPKVSVIMPCYNHGKYVGEAIESVLNQTYKDFELIVADNGSTDNSYEVIKRYEGKIKILKLEENNQEKCGKMLVEETAGEYIATMFSDDVWYPKKLEKQIVALKNNPKAGACFTWAHTGDENLNLNEESSKLFCVPQRSRYEWIKHLMENGNCLACPSVIMKKEIREKYMNKSRRAYRQVGDLLLWLNLLLDYEIELIEEPLMMFRWHTVGKNANSSNPSKVNLLRTWNEMSDLLKYILEEMNDDTFIGAFGNEFVNPDSKTHNEIVCEKYFWALKMSNSRDMYQMLPITFFHNNISSEIIMLLKEKYNYSIEDFWEMNGSCGFAVVNDSLKDLSNEKEWSYIYGVKDAYIKVFPENTDDIKRELFSLFNEESKQKISQIKESIRQITNMGDSMNVMESEQLYYIACKVLAAFLDYLNCCKKEIFTLSIIDEETFYLLEILVEKAREIRIDLYESVFPCIKDMGNKMTFYAD